MSEIGQVAKLEGSARVTGGDGATRLLAQGAAVFLGDRVETSQGGELTIVFSDGTSFYLTGEASMVLDELVYDPAGADNSIELRLLQGLFVFVAGEAAKTGGMVIETPTGQIGIRGTTVGIFIDPVTGATKIVNLAHPLTGEVGQFVFINNGGTTVFSAENQEISVLDSFSGHAPLVVQSPTAVEAFFGRGLRVLRQSGDLQRSDDEDGAARPTQADIDDAPGDGGAADSRLLSQGSGAAAGLTAAMESLTRSPADGGEESGLIALFGSGQGVSTPIGLVSEPAAGGGSDGWASLYIGFVWSGAAGDGLWRSGGNWYVGGQPGDLADVRIADSGDRVTYLGDPAVSLLLSSLSLQDSSLSIQSGKLGVQDQLAIAKGAALTIAGGTFASGGSANSGGDITIQSGSLEITGGAFRSQGTFLLDSGGAIVVSGGSVENAGSMTVETNLGFSSSQTLINSGFFYPGSGTATLSLDGNFQQLSGGTLVVQISSTAHDSLNITGTVQISGHLEIDLLGGYLPNPGDTFVILTAAQVQVGNGSILNPDIGNGREFKFSPTATTVELIVSDKPSNGADQIYGTTKHDFLSGLGGADQIIAGADNDILQGDGGADALDGGTGSDTAGFASSPGGVIGNLSGTTQMGVLSGQASDGYGTTDSLVSIENFDGSGWDDFFFGDGGDNFFDGHEGSDQLTGNGGSDTFRLRQGDGGAAIGQADVITDYTDGTDFIGLLDGLGYGDLTINDGGGSDTRISVTATGEFLALVQGVDDSFFDSSDFVTV